MRTPHTATHKQQPEHFGPRIFILNNDYLEYIIKNLYFYREHVREIAYGIASVRNPANHITRFSTSHVTNELTVKEKEKNENWLAISEDFTLGCYVIILRYYDRI